MRALILHANQFKSGLVQPSNWPVGIVPEEQKTAVEQMAECLVCFFTIETNDSAEQIQEFRAEIIKTAHEIGTKNLVLSPFVHLSNNIAPPEIAKTLAAQLVASFTNTEYTITTSHFGYHKSLLLNIKGHPGSFRVIESLIKKHRANKFFYEKYTIAQKNHTTPRVFIGNGKNENRIATDILE